MRFGLFRVVEMDRIQMLRKTSHNFVFLFFILVVNSLTSRGFTDPILAYTAEAEINMLQWSTAQPDWISIAFGKKLQILRV